MPRFIQPRHGRTHAIDGSDPIPTATGTPVEWAEMYRFTDKILGSGSGWNIDAFDAINGVASGISLDQTTGIATLDTGVYLAQTSVSFTTSAATPLTLRANITVTPDEDPDFDYGNDSFNGTISVKTLIANDTPGGAYNATLWQFSGVNRTVTTATVRIVRLCDY